MPIYRRRESGRPSSNRITGSMSLSPYLSLPSRLSTNEARPASVTPSLIISAIVLIPRLFISPMHSSHWASAHLFPSAPSFCQFVCVCALRLFAGFCAHRGEHYGRGSALVAPAPDQYARADGRSLRFSPGTSHTTLFSLSLPYDEARSLIIKKSASRSRPAPCHAPCEERRAI